MDRTWRFVLIVAALAVALAIYQSQRERGEEAAPETDDEPSALSAKLTVFRCPGTDLRADPRNAYEKYDIEPG